MLEIEFLGLKVSWVFKEVPESQEAEIAELVGRSNLSHALPKVPYSLVTHAKQVYCGQQSTDAEYIESTNRCRQDRLK